MTPAVDGVLPKDVAEFDEPEDELTVEDDDETAEVITVELEGIDVAPVEVKVNV